MHACGSQKGFEQHRSWHDLGTVVTYATMSTSEFAFSRSSIHAVTVALTTALAAALSKAIACAQELRLRDRSGYIAATYDVARGRMVALGWRLGIARLRSPSPSDMLLRLAELIPIDLLLGPEETPRRGP